MSGWLSEVKGAVEARLNMFFEDERARLVAIAPEAAQLAHGIESLTMRGGKRLRPAVLFAGYKAVRPEGGIGDVIDACAGLELLQSYLLIHDDWMDGDDERRGGPAVHAMFRESLGDAHLGASLAILAGNLACAQSWRLFGSDPEVLAVVMRMHEEVLVGQQLDLMAVEDVSRMHQLKTGSYTLRGPMALGAALGGASDAEKDALNRLATPLGEAFQMRDDLLGTFGDPKDTGKPAGNDLRAGKHNALIAAAEKSASFETLAPVRAVLGDASASAAAVEAAIEVLEASGAREAVESRLVALLDEARGVLAEAPLQAPGSTMLRELTERLAYRSA